MNHFFPRCQHLTIAGARCTYPALNGREFCYDHYYRRVRRRSRRTPILPDTRDLAGPLVTFVEMEDLDSVMANINEIAFAFAEHSIDHRQLSSLTYLMNTALKTIDRMHKLDKVRKEDMPTKVIHDAGDQPIALPDQPPAASTNQAADSAQPPENSTQQAQGEAQAARKEPQPEPDDVQQTRTGVQQTRTEAHHSPDREPKPAPAPQLTNPEPGPDSPASTPLSPEAEDAARLARQDRHYDEMFRRLNPWLFPEADTPAEPEPVPSPEASATKEPLTNSFSITCQPPSSQPARNQSLAL